MIDESLATPDKVRELQIKLYRNAENEPGYRFYLLYDKVYRRDVLPRAWTLAKANAGAPGVDGQRFEEIESAGVMEWLNGLGRELREKSYRASPVRRVMIDDGDLLWWPTQFTSPVHQGVLAGGRPAIVLHLGRGGLTDVDEGFSFVKDWVEKKVRRHLMRARKRKGFGWQRWSRRWLYDELGLFKDYRVRRPEVALKANPA